MKINKRFAALVLVSAATLAFTGCGGGGDEADSAASDTATAAATDAASDDTSGDAAAGDAAAGDGAAVDVPEGAIEVGLMEYMFDPEDLEVKAGEPLVFHLINTGVVEHDFAINLPDGTQLKSTTVNPGEEAIFEVEPLEAGEYEVVCTIPGHIQSGMVGTLTAA